MSSFRKALLWTAAPLIAVSIASAVVGILGRNYPNNVPVAVAQILTFQVAFWLAIIGIVAVIRAVTTGKKQRAAGILAGLGIGLVAYFASCFAGVGGL